MEKDCILSEYDGRDLENDLRRDENFDVWEYRGGGNCRNNRYGRKRKYMVLYIYQTHDTFGNHSKYTV